MRARLGTCISVSARNSCVMSQESVFHLMLQNNVAPNIGQKLSINHWPVILGAGLHTTCRGEWVLVVIRCMAPFLLLRPWCEKICTSFLNDAESLTTYGHRWRKAGGDMILGPPTYFSGGDLSSNFKFWILHKEVFVTQLVRTTIVTFMRSSV